MAKKKALARGRRKSIVAQYKAKAKGAEASRATQKPRGFKPPKKERPMDMVINGEKYSVGDFAYYVDEYNATPSRPKVSTGEIVAVHPEDNIAPCVSLTDDETRKYRVIRASLVGWSKKEALTKFKKFVKTQKKGKK